MDWQEIDRFPPGNGKWQLMRPPFARIKDGAEKLERAVDQWHPFDPVLVATPESKHFLPPICAPGLESRVYAAMLRRYRFLIAGLFLFPLVFLAAYLAGAGNGQKLLNLVFALAIFFVFFFVDYILVLRHKQHTQDRSLFVAWVYRPGVRPALVIILSAVFVAGLLQFYMQNRLGGLDPLIREYGLLYSAAEGGDWWRYATGPWIHSGIAHWINNAALLAIAAGLVSAVARPSILVYFVVVLVVSAATTSLLAADQRSDALVGISGGVLGLFGWLSGAALRNRRCFPRHFWVTSAMFGLLSIGISMLLSATTSNVVHISGFAMGLVLGMTNRALSPAFIEPREEAKDA